MVTLLRTLRHQSFRLFRLHTDAWCQAIFREKGHNNVVNGDGPMASYKCV